MDAAILINNWESNIRNAEYHISGIKISKQTSTWGI